MGCSYETAKQSIRINDTSPSTATATTTTTPTIATSHLNVRTKNFNFKTEKIVQDINNNNSKLNQHLIKQHTNDDCQLELVQQQQQPQKLPTIKDTTTTSTIKANKTSTITTVSKIYNFNNSNNYNNKNNVDNCNNKENCKINFYSLESKEYINGGNYIVTQDNIYTDKAEIVNEDNHVQILQESCINCYPLACHNRFCCEQQREQQHKQPPHLVVADKIANHTRQNLIPSNYINANNSKSYSCNSNSSGSNCSNNNYCRCHLSFFYPKHTTKNTLRNEQQCESHLCHCNCVATQTNESATFTNGHTTNEHFLQKTISYARTSLASNANDMKNNFKEVMTNCATVLESLRGINTLFIKESLNNDDNNNITSSNNTNNIIINKSNSNNHNKSEPYRGYCQRKHHLLNKSNYTSSSSTCSSSTYTTTSSLTSSYATTNTVSTTKSSTSTTLSNSCSLHDAISSNSRCNNNNHDMNLDTVDSNINNTKSKNIKNYSGNNKRLNKSCNNNNYHYQAASSSASSAHTAAFNYIGQNYYNFLRNTINFYTASSVILVLCYLTSTTSAATTKSDTTSVDKHPM